MSDEKKITARKIDHIAIAVDDLDGALDFFVELLGLEVVKVEESGLHKVKAAFLRAGDVMVEIFEPLESGPLEDFLAKRGPGFHHLCFEVPDLEEALEVVRGGGIRVIDEKPKPGVEGGRIAFLHPKSTGGAMIELCDKKEP